MTCAIIGDSIALALHLANPCNVTLAYVGASPALIATLAPHGHFDRVVISAGSNNAPMRNMRDDLRHIRHQVGAGAVVWVLPANVSNAAQVSAVARERHDAVVTFAPGRDGVHPRDVQRLWLDINAAFGGQRQ